MDADRFDRWARLLAQRKSRRTVAASLGAVAIASLAAPRWALGQDDDEDQDSDVDQHKDNPTGEDSDDDGQTDDDGGDDISDDDDGGDDTADDDLEAPQGCSDVTRCKAVQLNWSSGSYTYWDIGPIPDGPYAQHWSWDPFGCQISDHTEDELRELCEQAYPSNPDPLKVTCFSTEDGCAPCADSAFIGCR